jgi:hypothetical protein
MKLEDLDIELIVDSLKSIYNSKRKTFEAFRYNEIKFIVLSHLQTSDNISLKGKENFIDSFLNRFHKNEISVDNFLKFFEESKKEYFNKKEQDFTLLTCLSIDYLPFRKIKINNSTIRITGQNYPRKFIKSREKVLKKNREKDITSDFLKVTVQIKGKNFVDVYEQAYSDLNILRAFLCLNLNSYSEIPISNHYNRAINKVKYGQFHTLHYSETGETFNDTNYWIETDYPNKKTSIEKEKNEQFKKNINSWVKLYENCYKAHKNKLSKVLNLYVDAFDENDKQTCFLKSWIALENLLGTDNNNLLIKRCSAIFSEDDRPFQKQILKGLRIQRNLLVHENNNRIDSLVNCYHVQRFIHGLLKYNNLRYSKIIKNNEEAIKLLENRLLSSENLTRELKLLKEINKTKKY